MRAGRLVAAPPRGHRRQQQVRVEEAAAQVGEERHQGRRLRDAGPQRVDDGHVAAPHRFHEPGHAALRRSPELQRVAGLRRLAAQDQVDRLQAAQRLDVDAVVADGQVGALDEGVAHVAGQERMLEVVLRRRPRGQDDDAGVLPVPRRARGERHAAGLERAGEAPHLRRHQHVRQHRVDDDAVLEGEGEPGRRLGTVAEHPPAPVGRPHEVGGIEGEPASCRRLQPVASPQEGGVGVEPVRGQGALVHEPPRTVEVAEDRLVEPGALDDRPFQVGPLGPVDDARDEVEGPGALPGAAPPVDVERHAVVADEPAGLLRPAVQLVPAGRGEGVGHRLPVRPAGAVPFHHLVVVAGEGGVGGRPRQGSASGDIPSAAAAGDSPRAPGRPRPPSGARPRPSRSRSRSWRGSPRVPFTWGRPSRCGRCRPGGSPSPHGRTRPPPATRCR